MSSPTARTSGVVPHFSIKLKDLRHPNEKPIEIYPVHEFVSIKQIRNELANVTKYNSRDIQLFHLNNPSSISVDLKDTLTLGDLKIIDSISAENKGYIEFSVLSTSPLSIKANPVINDSVNNGSNIFISPNAFGTSGVYFVETLNDHNDHKYTSAVFKPFDEEQGMINNPKGYSKAALKSYFKPGQGIIREYAAYLLDVDNFGQIPTTKLVHIEDEHFHYGQDIKYPKLGALQEFVHDGEEMSNYGPNVFSDFEIQKIALLDMRLLNCDRNDENVLVVKRPILNLKDTNDNASSPSSSGSESYEFDLIPIDHAYCLPAKLCIDCWDWFWFSFPQVRNPIHPDIKDYILSIDIDKCIEKVTQEVSLSSDCIFLLRVVHALLVKAVEIGLTLFQVAKTIARETENKPSPLERLITEAEANAYSTIEARSGRLSSHRFHNENLKSPIAGSILSSSLDEKKNISEINMRRQRSHSLSVSNPAAFLSSLNADTNNLSVPSTPISSKKLEAADAETKHPLWLSENLIDDCVEALLSPPPSNESVVNDQFSPFTFFDDVSLQEDGYTTSNSSQLSPLNVKDISPKKRLSSIKSNSFYLNTSPKTSSRNSSLSPVEGFRRINIQSAGTPLHRMSSVAVPLESPSIKQKLIRQTVSVDETSKLSSSPSAAAWEIIYNPSASPTHIPMKSFSFDFEHSESRMNYHTLIDPVEKSIPENEEVIFNDDYHSSPGKSNNFKPIVELNQNQNEIDFEDKEIIPIRTTNSSIASSVTFSSQIESFETESRSKSSLSSGLSQVSALRRMVSFTASSSAPMYDDNDMEQMEISKYRHITKKSLEHQVTPDSIEFIDLRQHFIDTLIAFLVKKLSKRDEVVTTVSQIFSRC